MIHTQSKPFQMVLWPTEDHYGTAPGLKEEFETLKQAAEAFAQQKAAGTFRSGILFEWRRTSGTWELIDRFP